MVLPVSTVRGVKVYNLSSGKTLPQWLEQAKSTRALRNNKQFRSRIELVQDLEMPSTSGKVKVSSDGRFLIVSGVYPPQIRVYELSELSMKFERHLDAEIVQMEILSDDFSKMVFLRDDRTLEFHARYGTHHKVRVPRFGRDLGYQRSVCDLYVVGASSEAWRINLEQGRFLKGIDTNLPEINCCQVNPAHELLAFGGIDGVVELYDPRDRERIAQLDIPQSVLTHSESQLDGLEQAEISCLRFDVDGLTLGVGTSSGQVLLYDIRSRVPLAVNDHRYGLGIKNILFHQASNKILSVDSKILKFWDRSSFQVWTSIQPACDFNDIAIHGSSGIVFGTAEQSRVLTYYVPGLGPAPEWCAFLDSITEELEEDFGSTIYDDYKFVTRNDLVKMGLDHLIGSNLLRAYMHGFFMDMRLWKQVKAVSDPFEYENYLKQRVKKKIEEKTGSRISIQKKVPKVNRAFAETLLSRPSRVRELKQAIEAEDVDKAESTVKNPLLDDRFGIMFKDSSFEIDPSSEEYRRLHPGQVKKVDSRFDLVEGSEEEDIGSGAELDFEEDQESEEEEEEDSGEMFGSDEKDDEMDVHPKRQKVSMFGLKRGLDAPIRSLVDSQESRGSTTDLSELPLEERIRLENTSEEKLAESQPQVMFVRGRGRGRGQGRGRGRGRGSRGSRFRGRGRR